MVFLKLFLYRDRHIYAKYFYIFNSYLKNDPRKVEMSWIWRLKLNWDKTSLIHFKTVLNYWWPQSKKRFVISKIEKVRKALRIQSWFCVHACNSISGYFPPTQTPEIIIRQSCLLRDYPLLQLTIFYFLFV